MSQLNSHEPEPAIALEADLRRLTGISPYAGEQRWFILSVDCLQRLRDLAELGTQRPLPSRGRRPRKVSRRTLDA